MDYIYINIYIYIFPIDFVRSIKGMPYLLIFPYYITSIYLSKLLKIIGDSSRNPDFVCFSQENTFSSSTTKNCNKTEKNHWPLGWACPQGLFFPQKTCFS